MILEKDYLPMFRESEANGLIGIKGYLYYFQDMTTHYLHNLGKGNDTLPEEYGICCMYTKYRLHLEKQADYTSPLHMETWLEKNKSTATLYHSFTITKDKETYASGRVESCFFDMKRGCLTRASVVDFPENVGEDCRADVEPFLKKMPKSVDGMEYRYMHTVRYCHPSNYLRVVPSDYFMAVLLQYNLMFT